jgi:hypothetical protein
VTPIQQAIPLVLGAYRAALRTLQTPDERETLRDVIAAALARDYLADIGALGDAFPAAETEEAA